MEKTTVEKLHNDPSDNVRRAAVKLICDWAYISSQDRYTVRAMQNALNDTDGEVRCQAVTFWETLTFVFMENCASYKDILKCVHFIITAANDCEYSVRMLALKALSAIKCELAINCCSSFDVNYDILQCEVPVNSTDIESVLLQSDWQSLVKLENQNLENIDSLNSIVDDIFGILSTIELSSDNTVDCY